MALHRILVGLDGSLLAESILDTVQGLARRLRAEIVLLHVTPLVEALHPPRQDLALDDVIAREQVLGKTYLDGVAHRLREAGLTVTTVVGVGQAAAEIVRCAEHERIDLIALATHGRSGVQRWIHGSVADAVLHAATTALLLLRPTDSGARTTLDKPRLVVPLDGSSLAEGALAPAEELARALGAPIVLLRVVEILALAFSGDPIAGVYIDHQSVLDLMREDAERYLTEVASALRAKGLAVETVATIGIPVDTITVYTREHPGSLLVTTTHGRTGWRALVLGSVARRVVQLSVGPVLIVRPAEHAAAAHGGGAPGAATGG
jgi:nucleotide-binding universal stress UspA family protein